MKLFRIAYLARFLDFGVFSTFLLGDDVARDPDASPPDLELIIVYQISLFLKLVYEGYFHPSRTQRK